MARSADSAPGDVVALSSEAPIDWKKKGNDFLAEGRLDDAIVSYRHAIEADPSDPYAYVNLGYGLIEVGRFEEAAETLRNALSLDQDIFDVHYLLGQALASDDQFEEAMASFRKAVGLKPDFEIGFRDLGKAAEQIGKPEEAVVAYRQAILIKPDFVEVIHLLLNLLQQQDQFGEALIWADRLIDLGEDTEDVQLMRGQALHGLKRYEDSMKCCDMMLSRNAESARAWHARANLLFAIHRYEDALVDFRKALSIQPDLVGAISNCGAALQMNGDAEGAVAHFERALAMEPNHVHALHSLPFALLAIGKSDEAIEATDRAVSRHPKNADLHWNRSIAHLLTGKFEEGWAEYEWRWEATSIGAKLKKPEASQPAWIGQDLTGKTIILIHEQGLGDSIQFLRYAPLLTARGAAKVLLRIPEAMHPLVGDIGSGCEIVPISQGLPPFDFYCSMLSLPHAFNTTISTVPASVPYLRTNRKLVDDWSARLGRADRLRVGLVWSGNADHQNDRNRSIPLATILQDAPTSKIQFVSLQKEVRAYDQRTLDQHPEVFHFGDSLHTFADTAALIECMDVVVSVDTSVAHLAGALGRPLWLLLPKNPDWRWMLDREDSPWYPTARLFRQRNLRDWPEVLLRVMAELEALPRFIPA